jgi:Zn-dependent protease with chaperone function
MDRQAAEIVVHGVVAAAVATLLLHLQPSRASSLRLRLWLLALLGPLLLSPVLWVVFPARTGDAFRDDWALFSGSHWSTIAWHGVGAGAAFLVLAALLGGALFLRDLLPMLLDAVRARARVAEVEDTAGVLAAAVARAAAAVGILPPRLRVRDTSQPMLACRGLRQPVIVASTGLVGELTPDELAAALAHEMSHAKWRDPALGWMLMLVRALVFFSPGLQVAARALAGAMENKADESAARVVGDPRVVVRALLKLAGTYDDRLGAWQRLKKRAIEQRCAILLDERRMLPASQPALLVAAAGLALLLLFTVV